MNAPALKILEAKVNQQNVMDNRMIPGRLQPLAYTGKRLTTTTLARFGGGHT